MSPGPLVGHGGVGALCINGTDFLKSIPVKAHKWAWICKICPITDHNWATFSKIIVNAPQ